MKPETRFLLENLCRSLDLAAAAVRESRGDIGLDETTTLAINSLDDAIGGLLRDWAYHGEALPLRIAELEGQLAQIMASFTSAATQEVDIEAADAC